MTTDATTKAALRAVTRRHVIEDVSYVATVAAGRPVSESPVLCSCGETTTSGSWEDHRGQSLDAARQARYKAAAA